MFSGIVKEIGTIKNIVSKNKIVEFTIYCPNIALEMQTGSSIVLDGCCLTVVKIKERDFFSAQVTQETINRTNFKNLKIGSKVNLEPSLKLCDGIDGHLVSGHIDGTGKVVDMISCADNKIIKIKHPSRLKNFIAEKGSITVNGVSLTIIDSKKDHFTFTLIPYTRDNTNLGLIKAGDLVNLEVDLVSRYLVNYLENERQCKLTLKK